MKKYLSIPIVWALLLVISYFFLVFFLPLSLPVLPSSTIFHDKQGQEMGEVIYSGSVRHREITSEEIPDFYKKALVTLEDKTFWTNNGISFRGVIRSTLHNIQAGKVVEGWSTLSSGLIRNTFWIGENRTAGKKILEFLYAIRLNHMFSKDAILTEYINRVDFGYMNHGLKPAANYYFGREPTDLTQAEQIALLILPKDSKKYDPYRKPKNFRARFEEVVKILIQEQMITEEEWKNILNENLHWNTEHGNSLPYVVDFLKTKIQTPEKNPIRTTFDLALTEQIDIIAKNALKELAWKNVSDYGILIAERGTEENWKNNNKTLQKRSNSDAYGSHGSLEESSPEWTVRRYVERENGDLNRKNEFFQGSMRVMIGGVNYADTTAWQVNTTLALRQPGSTIKPFTYLLAFEKFSLTPESTIVDLPIAYRTSENYAYEPKNYSQDYKGEITLRQALSESVNIPAIKLAEKVGVPALLSFLRWLGISSLQEDADHYGLWLTLGNGEVSLLELLESYTIFANNGKYCPFRFTEDSPILPCIPKVHSIYTDMVVSILTDRYAKLGGFPLYSALDFPDRDVFVKTGTSRNFRDNWAVGFTDRYMIGVWTGNKSGEDMKGVTGATGAWEIFRRIVYSLERGEHEQAPRKIPLNGKPYLTITNPLEGSLYKQEPEKSANKQKVRLNFDTNILYDRVYWLLDEIKIDSDFIDLARGRHTIEVILMKEGEVKKEKNIFDVQ